MNRDILMSQLTIMRCAQELFEIAHKNTKQSKSSQWPTSNTGYNS